MNQPTLVPTLDLKASLVKPFKWAVTVGVLSVLSTLTMPNYYKSEARFLPVESKGTSGLGGLASAAAAFGVTVPSGDSSDANFIDVINSRWLREQLVQTEFQYPIKPWQFGAERIDKGNLYFYLGAKNLDQAVQGVGGILSASRDLKSRVITISAETKSPELSQLIVQRTGKLLEVFMQEKGRSRGGAKAAFAEARLADSRREMDEAEDILCRFLGSNRNFQTSTDPSVRLKGLRLETELRLRQQLVSAIAMNREQALLEEKNDIPILNILDSGNLPIDKSKPERLRIVLSFMVLAGLLKWVIDNFVWLVNIYKISTTIS